MSLEPHWYSTIYGMLIIGGQVLRRFAFVIAIARAAGSTAAARASWSPPKQFHDLGNLMLAFVMLWAYLAFSQFLIIWAGNLPEEIPWYLAPARRLAVGRRWRWCSFHFAVPFLLLLSRDLKRSAAACWRWWPGRARRAGCSICSGWCRAGLLAGALRAALAGRRGGRRRRRRLAVRSSCGSCATSRWCRSTIRRCAQVAEGIGMSDAPHMPGARLSERRDIRARAHRARRHRPRRVIVVAGHSDVMLGLLRRAGDARGAVHEPACPDAAGRCEAHAVAAGAASPGRTRAGICTSCARREDAILTTTAGSTGKTGVVRIPIARAMDLRRRASPARPARHADAGELKRCGDAYSLRWSPSAAACWRRRGHAGRAAALPAERRRRPGAARRRLRPASRRSRCRSTCVPRRDRADGHARRLLRRQAGDPGAGLLPLPDALHAGAQRAGRAPCGRCRSTPGKRVRRRHGQLRPARDSRRWRRREEGDVRRAATAGRARTRAGTSSPATQAAIERLDRRGRLPLRLRRRARRSSRTPAASWC